MGRVPLIAKSNVNPRSPQIQGVYFFQKLEFVLMPIPGAHSSSKCDKPASSDAAAFSLNL